MESRYCNTWQYNTLPLVTSKHKVTSNDTNSDQEREISFYSLLYMIVFNMSYVSLQQCFAQKLWKSLCAFHTKTIISTFWILESTAVKFPKMYRAVEMQSLLFYDAFQSISSWPAFKMTAFLWDAITTNYCYTGANIRADKKCMLCTEK